MENPLSQEVQLEEITEADVSVLADIMKRAFDDDTRMHTSLEEDGPSGYADGSLLRRLKEKENCTTGKILWHGEIVGGFAVSTDGDVCTLELLFIDPDRKSHGIGTDAWKAIRRKFPEARRWYVETPDYSTRNHRFYTEKCGFRFLKKQSYGEGAAAVFVLDMEK